MKKILLFTFLICTVVADGQTTRPGTKVNNPPVYFLDSLRMTTLPYFDLNKIDNINVVNDNDEMARTSGKIYIRSKTPKDFNFLTLDQVAGQNIPGSAPYLFMINNEFVKDIHNVKIDSSFILKCEIVNTKEFEYLQNLLPLTILNIKTKTKSNLDKENQIYIRGNEAASVLAGRSNQLN